MNTEDLHQLPTHVLFRIVRGDSKGRQFGTPRNPNVPTLEEFNPRIREIRVGELAKTIVGRRHGILPEVAELIGAMTDDDLIRFRLDDPISAVDVQDGLSLTGGHHRTHEIDLRVESGRLSQDTIIRILIHD